MSFSWGSIDESGGFRFATMSYFEQRMPCKGYYGISRFSVLGEKDLNTLRVDAYFFENGEF